MFGWNRERYLTVMNGSLTLIILSKGNVALEIDNKVSIVEQVGRG